MSSTKKSKDVGEHDYKVRDVVLAKIRGYPRWPGMVVDSESVPPVVAKERPAGKKTKFYCVRFFPAGDYSWAVSKDLSLLQKHEIEAYINEPHKKSGDLLQGYKIAINPSEWEAKLEEKRAALEELEADEEIDQLDEADDDDDEDEPKKAKTGKKRKREIEVKPKKKKEPKKSVSASTEAKDKKTPAKKKPGKKNGIRSKETIESEDDGEGDEGEREDAPAESSKKSGLVSKRAKKDKGEEEKDLDHLADNPDANKVREWRHKLQRAFLSKSIPKAEEMPEYDQLFTTIENHELTIEQLTFSKLGKVMRHISQLDQIKAPIPKEEQYNIRGRADALLERWQKLIPASEQAGANGGSVNGSKAEKAEKSTIRTDEPKESEAKPATNGSVKETADNSAMETDAAAPAADPPAADDLPMDTADD